MRKEILLMFFCATILVALSGGVFAGLNNLSQINFGNGTAQASLQNGANFSRSVLLNFTFNNDSDLDLPINGTASISLNVTFFAVSANGTIVILGKTQNCAQSGNASYYACWKTVILNSSLDGVWARIGANSTNSTVKTAGVQDTLTFINGTNILFDSTPPTVNAILTPLSSVGSRANYSGVSLVISVSVNDSKLGNGFFNAGNNNTAGMFTGQGRVLFNITGTSGVMNVSYLNQTFKQNATAYDYNVTINTSQLAGSGTYTVTVWANDTLNNINNSQSFTFILDVDNPTISGVKAVNTTQTILYATLTLDASYSGLNGVCTSDRTGATVTGTTLGTGAKTQYLSESGLNCGTTYAHTITCTDYAGNVGTQALSFATANCQGSAASGGSGGGSSTTQTWTKTIVVTDAQLTSSEGTTNQLAQNNQIELRIDGAKHHVGVTQLTATTATIVISSDPITLKLDVGQDAKIDLDKDGAYDLYVKLNGITNNKADVSVKQIDEQIPAGETSSVSTTGDQVTEGEVVPEEIESGSKTWVWVVVVILIVLIIGAGVAIKKRK